MRVPSFPVVADVADVAKTDSDSAAAAAGFVVAANHVDEAWFDFAQSAFDIGHRPKEVEKTYCLDKRTMIHPCRDFRHQCIQANGRRRKWVHG